jgi:3-keto-5-aminohexanoate cleavage enzyme
VKPEIEAFDLCHILKAAEMNREGRSPGTPYVQFVMGVKNAMPADRACSISTSRRSTPFRPRPLVRGGHRRQPARP